ncbi:MAG: hypothetical protein PF450_06805 [Bacteroidales bacterium]|jgi:hypothetical protein|nr:hypothetical protein [Bacteroidales bacterium]
MTTLTVMYNNNHFICRYLYRNLLVMDTMRYLTMLCVLCLFFGTQSATGQSKNESNKHSHHTEHGRQDTIHGHQNSNYRHRLSGTDFYLNIPNDFKANEAGNDDFAFQEKGTVVKFAFLENISVSTFCDSLTDAYFSSQGLRDMQVMTEQNVKIYRGKFDIGQVPYIRAFYVYDYKGSTVVGIVNYPEKLEEELAGYFLSMFITEKDE